MLNVLYLCEDSQIGGRLIELSPSNCADIVVLAIFRLIRALELLSSLIKLSSDIILRLVNLLVSAVEIVLLSSDFHELAGGRVKVLLELLQLTSLSEESFGGGSALVLENLLTLEVGSLSTLHELVSVALVSADQMVQGVGERLDFLFALTDLSIELVTVSLEFFLLLSSLDDIVSLGVLTSSLDFSRGGLVAGNEALIFDTEVLHLGVSGLKLNGDLVTLFFGSLLLGHEDVFVNLDFLLTLFHGHLKLALSVFKSVHLISFHVDGVSELLDFQLHQVVLNQGGLLLLFNLDEITSGHFVLENKLLDDGLELVTTGLDVNGSPLDVSGLLLELFVGGSQQLDVLLGLEKLLGVLLDLLLEVGLFILTAFTLSSGNLSLHILDLIVRGIKMLLLTLGLDL